MGHPYYKLRAGDYRAIITWDREGDLLIVEAVGSGEISTVVISVVTEDTRLLRE